MSARPGIDRVRFASASERDVSSGLLGWTSFTIAGLIHIDGVTVRRTRDGRLTLSFPARRDRAGVEHPILRPIDDRARRELEAAILGALGLDGTEAQQ